MKNSYLVNQQVTVTPEIPPTSSTKKLILIDHRVKDIDIIISATNENTYCLVFNYYYDTYETILSKIRFLNDKNQYILDRFYYEEPVPPTQMDEEGNHCTSCSFFDMESFQLLPATLNAELTSHTNNTWPFYKESSDIEKHQPIFFQRSKMLLVDTLDNQTITKYLEIPQLYVNHLDEIYEIGKQANEIPQIPLIFETIGIIQHADLNNNNFKLISKADISACLYNVEINDYQLSSWSSIVSFIQSLKTTYNLNTLDLMACALYADPNWKYVIDTLSIKENITIRASNDNTGTSVEGGNWILETNDINLTTVYFTPDIYKWKYLLATYIDNRFYALQWNNSMFANRAYDSRLKIADGTSNFTIETWYYETAKRISATIVDMGNYNYTLSIRPYSDGIHIYNLNSGWINGSEAIVPIAQWCHIAITRSGSTFTFYINGVAKQTITNSTSFYSNNSTFAIGQQSPDSCTCNVMKDGNVLYDLRLWNVARSASEIQMYRNRVVPSNTSGLVANYLCTDNTSTLNDRTSNALHNTIQNYDSARWSNSATPIPNIGFLINNGYSLTSYNSTALNALSHFDDITNTDFSNLNLSGVNFTNANLTGCKFISANLSNAILNGANLTNADLTNATLDGTYLIGANLTGAITTGSTIASAITTTTLTKSNSSAFYLTPPTGASITYGPTWSQLGSTIFGANANDSMYDISISKDGNIIAVSSPGNDSTGTDRGFVKVYSWNGSSWVQRGETFYGISNNDTISNPKLSSDGNYIAFRYNDSAVSNKGFIGIFVYDSNKTVEDTNVNSASYGPIGWSRVGGFIYNEFVGDNYTNIGLSGNGQIIALGCEANDGTSGSSTDNRGSVRVYKYNPNKLTEITDQSNANFGPVGWTRMGTDIDGESAGDNFGSMIELSTDGTVLAGAAVNSDVNGTDNGQVRVFKWNTSSSTWVQRGRTIYGQLTVSWDTTQRFAYALSLSANGNIIACGNSNFASYGGITKILQWNSFNNDYQMVGQQIKEYADWQLSGHSVSLSSDGQILAVGAYDADRGLSNNGAIRVYKLTTYATTLVSSPPANMTGYSFSDTIYRMTITGNSSTGSVWGTNIYTSDSNIARAAVHAGVIANGETKEIYLKMERAQYKYYGSTINSVTTTDFTNNSMAYLSYYFMDSPKLWVQIGNEIIGPSNNSYIGLRCAVSGNGTRFITGGSNNSNGLVQVYSLSSTDNYSHTSSASNVAEVYGDIVIPKKAGFTTIASKQSSTITTSLLAITGIAPTFTSFPSVSKFTNDPQFTLTLPESNSTGAFTLTTGTVGATVKYTRNALRFDGVNDTVILNSYPTLNSTNQFTLEGWVFIPSFPNSIIVLNSLTGIDILADGKISTYVNSSGSGWLQILSESSVPLNTWFYIAVVKNDNGYNKMYINNTIIKNSADTSSGNLASCTGISFAANAQANVNYFNIMLSEFRIWSIARTEKQIRDNYNREVLSNSTGLQVYYKFNQGTAGGSNTGLTTLTDSTSNGYHGTITNFALSGTTSNYVTGITILSKDKYTITNETPAIATINPDVSVNALNFNGTNNYIDLISNITEMGQGNFTIECWIKTTGSRMGILNCQDSDNPPNWESGEKSFYLDVSGKPAFVGFGNNFILSTQAVDDNNWHHVAVVWSYSTTTGFIYIDGKDRTNKVNNLLYQGNFNNTGRFIVGVPNNSESVNYFSGSMCELRIWSTARTASQIYQNFRRVLNGDESGLVCYNRLNQGTANGSNSGLTTATNNMLSGGFAGTLSGFSLVSNTSNWTDGVILRPNKDVTITGVGVATITAIQEEADTYDVGTTTATVTVALRNASSILTLDGVNDAVVVGVPSWSNSTQLRQTMTVECWFKTTDTSAQKGTSTFVAQYGISQQYRLHMSSIGRLHLWLVTTGGWDMAETPLSYNDGLWHHFAITYNSSNSAMILYVDGVNVLSRTHAYPGLMNSITSNTPLLFGSDYDGVYGSQSDRQFRGSLADIRIWSIVRTASEISNNYRQRLIGNETGLLGYWKLNQGNGTGWGSYTVAIDSTNNRAHGTLTNFASPSSNWTLSTLAFLPRISDITLGSKNGLYSLSDSSFTFIDPLSNSFGNFSYAINNASIASISNGIATTKTVYTTSGAVTIPTLSLYDFPEIASLADWEINVSFTVTGGSGSWRALIGDMYNEITSGRGWGIWVSAAVPPKIHWSFVSNTFEPTQTIVSLNTPYILNVVKSSTGTITLTLQNVSGLYSNILSISNLVASYSFDSNSNDSSGNNNNLTNTNTVTFNTSDYKRGSGAASFSGTNHFEIANDGRFSPDNFTVALWINPKTINSYQSIASCRGSSPWRGWMLYIGPSGTGSNLEIWSSSDGSNFTGQTSLFNNFGSLDTWVHLAFTLNKSTSALIVYINGTTFTTTTLGYTNNTTTNLRIGAGTNEQGANFNLVNGTLMDDFRFYNKVLSASEIGTLVADSSFSSVISIGANPIGKGPVTIGGWRSYGGEIFPGTISNVNVKVPTNQRLVTLLANTSGTPATITATQDSLMDFDASTKTASLTVGNTAPTLSNFTVAAQNFGSAPFSLTAPTSNSPGAFTYTSSNTAVATISGSTVTIVGAGSTTITATQATSGSYSSGTIVATFTVNQIAPTLSNFTVAAQNFGSAPFSLVNPTSNSGGAFTYTSSNTAVATISGSTVTVVGAGSSTITATQASTTNYTSGTITTSFTVNQIAPTISNFTVAAKNFGSAPFSLTAPTSNSGGAFTYTSSNTAVATISGSTVTIVSVGSSTITATQASTTNYTSGTVVTTFTVNQIAPTIGTLTVPAKIFGDAPFILTDPTSNSSGSFSYTSSNTAVATIGTTFTTSGLIARYDASATSNYTLSGGNVTQWNDLTGNGYHLIPNGTGPTVSSIKSVSAFDFNSSRGFIKTSVPLSSAITIFMVIKYSTNIGNWGSFMHHGDRDTDWAIERNSWPNAMTSHNIQFQSNNVNGPPELSTTNNVNYILIGRINGSSREFWRYSDTEALGFASGSGVSIATGNKTIYVGKSDNNEACNSTIGEILYYNSSLSDANLNTTLVYLQNKWFNNITDKYVTIVGAGTSTITATQASTTNYTSGNTTSSLVVSSITPTLSNFTVAAQNFGSSPFSLTAPTSNSGGAFTYTSSNTAVATISGSTVTVVGAGSSTITATQAASGNYSSGTIVATFTVNQIAPTISNLTIAAQNFGSSPFSLVNPTSNSGGAFTYTSSNTAVATISGSTITVVGAGSSTITATQASTTNYTSGNTSTLFTVNPIAPTLSNFTVAAQNFGSSPFSLTAPTSNSGGSFTYTSSNTAVATISGSTVTVVGAGSSTITATQASTTNYTSGTTTTTFTVNQIAPTLSNFTVAAQNFGSAPFSLVNPTSNSGGAFTYTSSNTAVATISGSTVTILGGGTTTITATQAASGNYASGTITTSFVVSIPSGISSPTFTKESNQWYFNFQYGGSTQLTLFTINLTWYGGGSINQDFSSLTSSYGTNKYLINDTYPYLIASQNNSAAMILGKPVTATINYTESGVAKQTITTFVPNPITGGPYTTGISNFNTNILPATCTATIPSALDQQRVNAGRGWHYTIRFTETATGTITGMGTFYASGSLQSSFPVTIPMALYGKTFTCQLIIYNDGGSNSGDFIVQNYNTTNNTSFTIPHPTGIYSTQVTELWHTGMNWQTGGPLEDTRLYRVRWFVGTTALDINSPNYVSKVRVNIKLSSDSGYRFTGVYNYADGLGYSMFHSSIRSPLGQNIGTWIVDIRTENSDATITTSYQTLSQYGGVPAYGNYFTLDQLAAEAGTSIIQYGENVASTFKVSNFAQSSGYTWTLNGGQIYKYLTNVLFKSASMYGTSISTYKHKLELINPDATKTTIGLYDMNGSSPNITMWPLNPSSTYTVKITIVDSSQNEITNFFAMTNGYDTATFQSLALNVPAAPSPTLSNFTVAAKNYGAVPFNLTAPTTNSSGAFTYTSSNTAVATISGTTVTIVGGGSSTITATQADTGVYTSGTITASLVVSPIAPTLSNFSIATKYFGQPTFSLTAPTTNSNGAFTYTSSNTAVATISGTTVTILSVGTSTITATLASTSNYTSGTIVTTLTVNSYENANLTGIDLSNNNLTGLNLSNSILTNVKSGSIIGNPTLPTNYTLLNGYIIGPNVNLSNVNLTSQNLTNANFTGANLTGANLTSATLIGVISGSITGTPTLSASYSIINGYILGPSVNLSSKDLSNMNLLASNLTNVNLNSANIDNTDFSNTTLTGVKSGSVIGTPILPNNYYIIKGCIVGSNVDLTGAVLTNINYSKVSYNAFDDFISGSTAQSTSNDWQYFEVNTDRSSASLLSNWQNGNPVILTYGQWDNNRTTGDYPFVQKVTGSGLINSSFGSGASFTGPALVMHPDESSTYNVGMAFKNNTGNTININIDLALSLLFPSNNNDGINYYIQRGLINDARYKSYVSSSIPTASTNTFTFNKKNIELQNGEYIYLILNRNGSYNYDHTRVVFNVTVNDLKNLTLTNVNFTNANLSGTNLSNVTLTNSNISNTDFRTATLTNLISSGLTGTPLLSSNYNIVNSLIIGPNVNLTNVDLSNQNLTNINLSGTTLTGVNLTSATLSGVISGSVTGTPTLSAAYTMINGYIIGPNVNLTNATLTSQNLTGKDLSGTNLTSANLTSATLTGVKSGSVTGTPTLSASYNMINGYIIGPNVNLTNAALTSQNLTGKDLSGTNLTGTNLTSATLTGVISGSITGTPTLSASYNMINGFIVGPSVNLSSANLSSQNLTGKDLSNADLSNANLSNATVTNIILSNTNINNANITNITFSNIQKVQLLKNSNNRSISNIQVSTLSSNEIISLLPTSSISTIHNISSVVFKVIPPLIDNTIDLSVATGAFYVPSNINENVIINGTTYYSTSSAIINNSTGLAIETLTVGTKIFKLFAGSIVGVELNLDAFKILGIGFNNLFEVKGSLSSFSNSITAQKNLTVLGNVGINKIPSDTYKLDVLGTARASLFTTTSDYRIKEDISNIQDEVNIDELKPVKYKNKLNNKIEYGFIAHEVQDIFPELVQGDKDEEEYQSINYLGLIPILVNEIKKLKEDIQNLKRKRNENETKTKTKRKRNLKDAML